MVAFATIFVPPAKETTAATVFLSIRAHKAQQKQHKKQSSIRNVWSAGNHATSDVLTLTSSQHPTSFHRPAYVHLVVHEAGIMPV